MRNPTGATPLFALSKLALDLETTSLDAEQARIVQIGLLAFDQDRIEAKNNWETLVDPGIAIPPRSSSVHGITTEMIRTAKDIRQLWSELMDKFAGRVIIGHTIAYDLTVLENEARRHGFEWQRPRSLCIRTLAPFAVPELHNHSLDALAEWFNIPIEKRHSALSDALASAQIFLEMVPLLQERGISTLAEAERLTLQKSRHAREARQAGWVMPSTDPTTAAGENILSGDVTQFDTYAYRHTTGSVMARPVLVAPPQKTIAEAMKIMAQNEISSLLFAKPARPGQPISTYSILTERDVLRHIAAKGATGLKTKAGSIAISPVHSIRENAFIYRAMARMRRLKIRHLAVVNDQRELTGMISARDTLKLRTDAAISLDDAINEAQNAGDMAAAWASLPSVVNSLIAEELEAHTITRIVSEEIRSMTGQAAKLAEAQMLAEGLGEAPCAYAVLVLGSAGRGESLLKPDQDNAIIFERGEPGGTEDQWFGELGRRFADILDKAGIPLCDGGVMAKNAPWRGSADLWRKRLGEWIASPKPQNLLNVDILYDLYPVHGRSELGFKLFTHAYQAGAANPAFAKSLGALLEKTSNPFGFFGQIKAENNQLDLKLHGLFPIVAAARTLAIRHNIAAHATRERLEGLLAMEKGDTGLLNRLIEGHGLILSLMLASQEREISSGRKPSNFVDLGQLDSVQTKALKSVLSDVQLIPSLVRDLMF